MALTQYDKRQLEKLAEEAFRAKQFAIRNGADHLKEQLTKNPPAKVAKLVADLKKARLDVEALEEKLSELCYRLDHSDRLDMAWDNKSSAWDAINNDMEAALRRLETCKTEVKAMREALTKV